MRFLATIIIFCCITSAQTLDWLPKRYSREAVKYYDQLDSRQWTDVYWHNKYYGIRQAVFAGMEGSNRSRGKHGDEDTYQDVGVSYGTAKLYRSGRNLRGNLKVHNFAAKLSAEIDSANLAIEFKRGSKRPELNAAMWYPGGKKWRSRLKYGMAFTARERELEKRLVLLGKKLQNE